MTGAFLVSEIDHYNPLVKTQIKLRQQVCLPTQSAKREDLKKVPIIMNKTTTELFYRKLKNANPNPKGELNYINSYTLLVAVVLSAQATDVSVNKATKNLFKIANFRPWMCQCKWPAPYLPSLSHVTNLTLSGILGQIYTEIQLMFRFISLHEVARGFHRDKIH